MNNHRHVEGSPRASKRLWLVGLGAAALLSVLLVVVLFRPATTWDLFDLVFTGIMLLGASSAFVFITGVVKKNKARLIAGALLGLLFLLCWAELGVGVFGTPFAGN